MNHHARHAVRRSLGAVMHGPGDHSGLNRWLARVSYGPSPFSRDWDLLIVMDTLRVDALEAVAPEYDWLPDDIPATRSPASWSRDWLVKAADVSKYGDVMADTHAVAWNPFTGHESSPDEWYALEEVWRHEDLWDSNAGIRPREVTNRAIRAGRESGADRVFAWYQQPHAPYPSLKSEEPLTHDQVGRMKTERKTVWDACKSGEMSREEAWTAMLDNLRRGLDDVEILLQNFDAERAILTADHGEAFGELGGLLWGHGAGIPHPALIRVPWVEVNSSDEETHIPHVNAPEESVGDVTERLEALGYV